MNRTLLVVGILVALVASMSPAAAEPGQRDIVQLLRESPERYTATTPGVPVDLSFVYGPYVVPPGQDSNRITLDLPVNSGFITAIAPELVVAPSGRIPTQQEAHIHHAHWFRVTNDPEQEYYTDLGGQGLSWVFGTGEEKTQGRMDDRARRDQAIGNNWDYGIPIDGDTPQGLIYMIHNKQPSAQTFFVVLDVTFVPGTREQVKAVTGRDIHPIYGQLWGQTKDVTLTSPRIGASWEVTHDGVAIAAGGHLHPGAKKTVVSNLGQRDASGKTACERAEAAQRGAGDPDGDGFLGVAILDSYKYDREIGTAPYSENYQMGATKYGWRAPLHKGDVLRQEAVYALDGDGDMSPTGTGSPDGRDHNWYEAMTYTGIYMDREYTGLATPAGVCSVEALGPRLLGEDTFEQQGRSASWLDATGAVKRELEAGVAEVRTDWNRYLPEQPTAHQRAIAGMVNHVWGGDPEPLCALPGVPALASKPSCGPADIATTAGPVVDTIHVAGFLYAPGDLATPVNGSVLIPSVERGTPLNFVNEDVVANVRHTFTSCAWPCVGPYVSNFPLPTGGPLAFDTGKIGNLDPIDGGVTGDDTAPLYTLDTSKMPVGRYSYFCRIHPFMRGAFQVVAPSGSSAPGGAATLPGVAA